MLTALILATTISAPFDKADYAFLSVLVLESAFDVATTEYSLHKGTMEEGDPLLGKHPSPLRMWGSFVAAQVVLIGVSRLLPDPYRKLFEGIVVGAELGNIIGNFGTNHKAGYSFASGFKMAF